MIADQTESLAGITRHDYLPFGEEVFAGTGGRSSTYGYSKPDGVRQHFTGYERDDETGLDYGQARYYANVQGRFSGVDPILINEKRLADPQMLNLYAFARDNPMKYTDPSGREVYIDGQQQEDYINSLTAGTITSSGWRTSAGELQSSTTRARRSTRMR